MSEPIKTLKVSCAESKDCCFVRQWEASRFSVSIRFDGTNAALFVEDQPSEEGAVQAAQDQIMRCMLGLLPDEIAWTVEPYR